MKINTLILIAFFGILSIGCSKTDDSPILSVVDIESEKISLEKPTVKQPMEYSEFN